MKKVRINKFLSIAGVCSRRKADEHILAGEVTVNNAIAKLGDQITSGDIVSFKGKETNNISSCIYIALYKPRGVISTVDDELKRKSVIDFLPKEPRVYPIGRLDKESEGLIILTNDGDLTNKLSHPKFEHEKEYKIIANGIRFTDAEKSCPWDGKKFDKNSIINSFEKGLKIDNILMKADRAYDVKINNDQIEFNLILHTGYNRQIRKMCDKIGLSVRKLTRIRIGNLRLSSLKLKIGAYKEISKSDILS